MKKLILLLYDFLCPKESVFRYFIYRHLLIYKYPSNVEKVLKIISQKKTLIQFIQIGSNNGNNFDPIFKYIKRHNWRGVMIEPHIKYFHKLKKLHKNNENLNFENVAIGTTEEDRVLYFFEHLHYYPIDRYFLTGVNSFYKDILLDLKIKYPKLKISKQTVKCITFQNLINKYRIQNLDLLVIDTEGCEAEILLSIDYNKICPGVIIFEFVHLSKPILDKCLAILRNVKYRFLYDSMDIIAIHESVGELEILGRGVN